MRYTEKQINVLKVIKDLIEKGATEITIGKHVFGFDINIKAN